MNDRSERLERHLRDVLRDRDPGSAPVSLRARVAAASFGSTARQAWWSLLFRPARRAVATLATVAAVVLGVVGIATLGGRSAVPIGVPGASGPPVTEPGAGLALAGPVLAVPPELVSALVAIVLVVTAIALEPGPGGRTVGLVAHPPRGFGWLARPRRRRLAILGVGVVIGAGVWYASSIRPLEPGSSSALSMDHLLGVRRSVLAGVPDVAYYHMVPGGTVSTYISIRNASDYPITVLGWESPSPHPIQTRIPTTYVVNGPSRPFEPFELAPHAEQSLAVSYHMSSCDVIAPASSPEPEPSADMSGDYSPADGEFQYGTGEINGVDLTYSILGLSGKARVPYPTTLMMEGNDGFCEFDANFAGPSPSPH